MTTTNGASDMTVANDPTAHTILRAAHEGGYRFPLEFPGFTADIVASEGRDKGAARMCGSVSVSGPRAVDLITTDQGDLAEWAKQEVASIAGHRWPVDYAQSDGRWTLSIEGDQHSPLGRLITVHDDPFHSSYRVRDSRLFQVTRQMGATRFTISNFHFTTSADGRVLPTAFVVNYWNAEDGRLTRSDAYTDRYEMIDGVLTPSYRHVLSATDDGLIAREVMLSNITLLDMPATT